MGQRLRAATESHCGVGRVLADTFLGKTAEADPGRVGRAVDKSQS